MPRQNTCPKAFPDAVLGHITQLAQQLVHIRKSRGETQAQWAEKLGISQPTMARLERGDPAIASATYITCLWLLNPQLDLRCLLPSDLAAPVPTPGPGLSAVPAPAAAQPLNPAEEFAALLAQWQVPAL